MAEINVERKERSGIARWLIPLALLGLLAFALVSLFDRDDDDTQVATAPATTAVAGGEVGATPDAATTGATGGTAEGMIPVAAILAGPTEYANRTVAGTARVTEVISDRGFWIEENGQRMFVVLGEKGAGSNAPENAVNVQAGQTVRLSGHVYTTADQVPGSVLEQETRTVIADQKAFLHVLPRDVAQMGS